MADSFFDISTAELQAVARDARARQEFDVFSMALHILTEREREGAVISEETLERMTVAAGSLGWPVPVPEAAWPETFDRNGKTYLKDHLTVAKNGDVQCGEYVAGDGEWLIVYNE